MYERMLIPLDGSELAEVVLDYAKELAAGLELKVILLHVYSSPEQEFITMHRGYVERVAEIMRHQLQEIQQRNGIQTTGRAVDVRTDLAMGHTADKIVGYADENNVDLILMATHGRSGIRRWAIGSVADKVIRATKKPVMLVRAKTSSTLSNKVLVPLDGSKQSEAVVSYVDELATRLRSEVILLQVLEPSYRVHTSGGRIKRISYTSERIDQLKEGIMRYLERIATPLRDKDINVKFEVRIGEVPQTIINFANEYQAGLVAMLKRGRYGMSSLDLGSVADKVLRRGTTPILLVSPKKVY